MGNRILALVLLLGMAALFAATAWWWNIRLDRGELLDVVHRDAGQPAMLVSARVTYLESGISTASANLLLEYSYQDHRRSVSADLRLQRVGKRWHVSEVFAGGRSYPGLQRLGRDVGISLAGDYAGEQTRKAVEATGDALEALGTAVLREAEQAAEALRDKWGGSQNDG